MSRRAAAPTRTGPARNHLKHDLEKVGRSARRTEKLKHNKLQPHFSLWSHDSQPHLQTSGSTVLFGEAPPSKLINFTTRQDVTCTLTLTYNNTHFDPEHKVTQQFRSWSAGLLLAAGRRPPSETRDRCPRPFLPHTSRLPLSALVSPELFGATPKNSPSEEGVSTVANRLRSHCSLNAQFRIIVQFRFFGLLFTSSFQCVVSAACCVNGSPS